jgi:hypothetical protein
METDDWSARSHEWSKKANKMGGSPGNAICRPKTPVHRLETAVYYLDVVSEEGD